MRRIVIEVRHPLLDFFKTDLKLTKARMNDRIKAMRNYQYFRARGFTRRAAWFNAMNVL